MPKLCLKHNFPNFSGFLMLGEKERFTIKIVLYAPNNIRVALTLKSAKNHKIITDTKYTNFFFYKKHDFMFLNGILVLSFLYVVILRTHIKSKGLKIGLKLLLSTSRD